MTYLKTLIALTTLALLTACGGATPTATGDSSQTTDCAANPFGASCIAEDIGAPMRLTACLADIRTNPLCTGDAGIATVFCEENPFDTRPACTADDYADERLTACTGDITTSRCMPLVTPVCEMDFNNAVCRGIAKYDQQLRCADGACVDVADLPNTILTAPEEKATPTTDFADGALSVTLIPPTDGTPLLNPDGTDNTTISTTAFPTGTTVREGVADLRFRRRGGRGSSDDDGFVTFRLLKANADDSVSESVRVSTHGAILPTTNLGAPLTDAPATAVWPGHFYNGREIFSTDFYIMFEAGLPNNQIGKIDFAKPDGTGIATATADRPEFTKGQFSVTFAVTFDAKGVLSGTIQAGFDPSNVLGLIGTEGVVGVGFGGEDTVGFSATNPDGGAVPVIDPCIGGLAACYGTQAFWLGNARSRTNTDFLRIPTVAKLPSVTDSHSFITAGATELNLTNAANKNAIRLGDLTGNDNNTSGFAIGEIGSGEDLRRYVGILAGTTVGAPLSANINTQWTGMLAIQREAFTNKAVTLDVVFAGGAGTIKTQTGGFDYDTTGGSVDPNIVIDGAFGTNGVIYGTTTGINTNSFSAGVITGTLTGLIGVNGAVGVFVGNDDADEYGYAGGFVVTPPE